MSLAESLPVSAPGSTTAASLLQYVSNPFYMDKAPAGQLVGESESPEVFRLGTITKVESIAPSDIGIEEALAPKEVEKVTVSDPYVEQWSSEVRADVAAEESRADTFARNRREAGRWERKPRTAYYDEAGNLVDRTKKRGWGDPVSRNRFFGRLDSPGINAWRRLIPSARALGYLSDPNTHNVVLDFEGQVVTEMDEKARMWLSLCSDAVGIRSRATVMAEAVDEYVQEKQEAGKNPNDLRWLSIACGTALPSMKAATRAGIAPSLLLADLDDGAMSATVELGKEVGFKGTIQENHVNIFDANEMAKFRDELEKNGGLPDLIDAMGIFEYTGDNLGIDSVVFLRSMYDMLAPGGRLVFGQMRSDRPNPDFTMGVVSWPYVEMRSPRGFMEIIEKAGIPVRETRLYLPDDGAYTVGTIDKPL